MSVSEKTRRALKEFGLTEYEAKVYVSLVESGTQAASELSRTASIPYSKIYEILGNLERKGWVETEQGRPSKYYPKAPSTALESSRARLETTLKSSQADAMEELQPLYEKKGVNVSVMVPQTTSRDTIRKLKGLAQVRTREQMFGGGIISDDNQIVILLGEDPQKGLTLAISSDHIGLVKFGKSYFEYLWESSKPLS